MRRARLLIFLGWLALAGGAGVAAAAEKLPTTEDIQGLVEAGKHQEALKAIALVLPSLGSDKGTSGARYTLYVLRGESQLQLKQGLEASRAFRMAQAQAPKDADAALAGATALLIEHSSNLSYKPLATGAKLPPKPAGAKLPEPPPAGTPIGIVDQQQRKAALTGLFYDQLAAEWPRFKAAKASTAVPPILTFAGTLETLRCLELAGTGGHAYTREMMQDLGDRARDLMKGALASMGKQVEEIARHANESVVVNVPEVTGTGTQRRTVMRKEYRRRGLTPQASGALSGVIATCKEYDDASRALESALQVEAKSFHPLIEQANSLSQKAHAALNADYSQRSARPLK